MKTKAKLLFLSVLCVSSLNFLTCNNADDENENQNREQKSSEDGKTYLQVKNNSQFDINVYFQAPKYSDPWMTLEAGKSEKKEISASKMNAGDGIYIQYLYPIGSIVIPYYDVNNIPSCFQNKQVVEKKVNSITVPQLSTLTLDTKYLIVKNESDVDIALHNGEDPVTPLYQETYWITPGNYRIYELKDIDSLENYSIGNSIITNKNLPLRKLESGCIHTLRYSNSSIDLLSITKIDISAKNKIWKLPLSQTSGKYLSADKFSVCENSSDGYVLTGQISFNKDSYTEKSLPYIAEITPSGDASDSTKPFKDSPKSVKSDQLIEAGGMRIVAGTKMTDEGKKLPFIYGDKGCNFYTEPSIGDFCRFSGVLYKGNNVFAFLFEIGNDENTNGFGIFELTVKSYSEAEGGIVYSDTSKLMPQSFINTPSEYVVLVQEDSDNDNTSDKSKILFITNSEPALVETKVLDKYLFNSIVRTDDEKFAFASGSYLNAVTGKNEASFMKIDLENREFCDNGKPKRFPATEANLNSNFTCLSIKGDEVFLAGFKDRDYTGSPTEYRSGYPYLVSFDTKSDKENWSQIYNDEKYAEFEIRSCYLSAIGTPLIEIYNAKTGMAYLASCGLLGEIPDTELATLPRNTSISDLPKSYKVSFVTNCETPIDSYRTGNITSIPKLTKEDYEFDGWYTNPSFKGEPIAFPYELTKDVILYAKWAIEKCTITYVTNCGTTANQTTVDKYSKLTEDQFPKLTKTDYEFQGWYASASFEGDPITFPYELTKDTTFYAKWAIEKCTITYVTNCGTTANPTTVDKYSKLSENQFPKLTNANLEFDGWYTSATFEGEAITYPYEVKNDTALYAKWLKVFTFDATGIRSSPDYNRDSGILTLKSDYDKVVFKGDSSAVFNDLCIKVSNTNTKLIFDNFSFSSSKDTPLIESAFDISIEFKGTNKLSSSSSNMESLIKSSGAIEIKGDNASTFALQPYDTTTTDCAIVRANNVTINGGNVEIKGSAGKNSTSCKSNGDGNDGKNGSTGIYADVLIKNNAVVTINGGNGGNGKEGENGADGSPGRKRTAIKDPKADDGEDGKVGKKGGAGGNGGNAIKGNLIIKSCKSVTLTGGNGGQGGLGGNGGKGGKGGDNGAWGGGTGNGGQGGKAGDGGKGGNGGDAVSGVFAQLNGNDIVNLIFGQGGEGGKSGAVGLGGSAGDRSDLCGGGGISGNEGAPGEDGTPGKDGVEHR